MKPVRQAIVLVDTYRKPSLRRSTYGRYRVGAKTEKEVIQLVKKVIGFGHPQFYYWEDKENYADCFPKYICKYKEVVKETKCGIEKPFHSNDPVDERNQLL